MLSLIVADKNYTEYKFKYYDLVQKENKQGIKMTLNLSVTGIDMLTPKFKINDSIIFQAQYVHFYNEGEYYQLISIKLTEHVQDSLKFIVNITSDKLNIKNKQFNISDHWQILFAKYRVGMVCSYDIDITPIETSIETSISAPKDITVDQIDKTSIGTSIAPLHNDEELTDFELRGEDGTIRVHRAVLAAASPVLRRMLCGTWKETAEGHVDVPGTSKLTLQQFKDFVYLHSLPETGLEQLLLLASCYMMPDLEQKCVDKLLQSLTAQNTLCEILKFATTHNLAPLLLAILKHFINGKLPVKAVEAYMSKNKESDEKELEK